MSKVRAEEFNIRFFKVFEWLINLKVGIIHYHPVTLYSRKVAIENLNKKYPEFRYQIKICDDLYNECQEKYTYIYPPMCEKENEFYDMIKELYRNGTLAKVCELRYDIGKYQTEYPGVIVPENKFNEIIKDLVAVNLMK